MLMNKNVKKVFVGVSGGVDSSVALALLKNEGYDVTGVFLKVWAPDFLPCDWREERRSAMRVCATLDVPFITLDCEVEYKKEVVDYMIREYSEGRVPNPDVFCNKYVKFGVFLKRALEMGADYVATGHYAQVVKNMDKFKLCESTDKEKDQSYFVYTLGQYELSHTLFPIGHMTKPEVRKLAHKFGLPTATKKDSQGLCFIGKIDMKEFLTHYIETKEGDVLNTKGEVIGFHDGAIFLTIGQRHGFTVTKKNWR
jgi:tRNA-specific 2-thiouridylase